MPTGSVTLLEAAKSGDDMVNDGVVETLVQESPILQLLPQMGFMGNAYQTKLEVNLPTPQFRKVNATYTRQWGTDREVFWGVAILGQEVFLDNYIVRVSSSKESAKAKQFRKTAKAMSRTFDATFFDGTGTADDFKGVNTLIDEGFGQLLGAATDAANGGALVLDDLDHGHDLLRSQSVADAILLNRTTRRRITSQARDPVNNGFSLIDTGDDKFGNQVTHWNGVPMHLIGDDITGAAILGYDETRGTNADCASLYMVAFGEEENVHGIMGAGGHFEVVDFGETEAAPGHLGRVEVYPGICIANPYSIVRLEGIRDV